VLAGQVEIPTASDFASWPFAGYDDVQRVLEQKARERAIARAEAGLAPDPDANKPSPDMLRRWGAALSDGKGEAGSRPCSQFAEEQENWTSPPDQDG
jgi:hypothetical protein